MIRLYHYKNNFGDVLGPYIVGKLSGEVISYRRPFSIGNLIMSIFRFMKLFIYSGRLNFKLLYYSPFKKVLLAIGSILGESTTNTIVWGSGIGSRKVNIVGGQFTAVRGPLSQKRLSELGYLVPETVGDPALLLPIVYDQKVTGGGRIGIIPHIIDYKDVAKMINNEKEQKLLLIDFSKPDVEEIVDEIVSCDYIISSSLHGLIVAHAYKIPAIWFQNNKLYGDGSKFDDYFLSVGIEPYTPLHIDEIYDINIDSVNMIFEKFRSSCIVNKSLSEIQLGLLNVAPFHIKSEYFKLVRNED